MSKAKGELLDRVFSRWCPMVFSTPPEPAAFECWLEDVILNPKAKRDPLLAEAWRSEK